MGSPLRVTLAALASLAVVIALPAGGVAKTKPKPKPPTQAVVAKKLVTGLVSAKTAAARSKAMVALMRALHIGVVSSAGKPIVTSPEPNAARLAEVYDFELRGLSEQLQRKQTTTFDDLAAALKKGESVSTTAAPFRPRSLQRPCGTRRRTRSRTPSPRHRSCRSSFASWG